MAPCLRPPKTSPVVVALPCCWIVIKSSSVCCICFCIFTFLLLCLVILCCCLCWPLGRVLYYEVCHFCHPYCMVWVLLCNQLGFLPTQFGSFPMLKFSIKFLLSSKKKRSTQSLLKIHLFFILFLLIFFSSSFLLFSLFPFSLFYSSHLLHFFHSLSIFVD